MKRVGLITYYGENYGGMLQAYALQKRIGDMGYGCELVSNDFLYMPNRKKRIVHKAKKVFSLLKNPCRYLSRRKAIRSGAEFNALRSAEFKKFMQQYLKVYKTGYTSYKQHMDNPLPFDGYICGSDQIWNPNLYCDNGFYFGAFAPENRKVVSYASSIGVSSVTEKQGEFLKENLKKLAHVSVRENEGADLVEKLIGTRARVVLDPTLLLTKEQWAEIAVAPEMKQPYIFCYLFGERDYIDRVKRELKALTGLEIVCVPYASREFAGDDKKVFDAGPAEFIGLIKNATYVLTDSFHATAFSVNLGVPFFSLLRFADSEKNGMNSRLYTILSELGLRERIITENDKITADMLQMDFSSAHTVLEKKREEDTKYLQEILLDLFQN